MDSQDSSVHVVTIRESKPPDSAMGDEVQLTSEPPAPASHSNQESAAPTEKDASHEKPRKCSSKNRSKKGRKPSKSATAEAETADSSAQESAAESSSESDLSDSEDGNEVVDKKQASKKQHCRQQKTKKKTKAKKAKQLTIQSNASSSDSESSSSDSDDNSDSSTTKPKGSKPLMAKLIEELQQTRLQQARLHQDTQMHQYGNRMGLPGDNNMIIDPLRYQPPPPSNIAADRNRIHRGIPGGGLDGTGLNNYLLTGNLNHGQKAKKPKVKTPKTARLEFKRVDQVWDNTIHNYKLQDTAEGANDTQYDEYVFHVRRTFDWEGKYKQTLIDIKSKLLRECLQDVMGNIKGVSLVEDTPKLDPNLLFLYLEDLRKHLKDLKKIKISGGDKHSRKKEQKRIDTKRQHLKVLVKYIDKDYDTVKNSLYPMLENGLITFDLLWALWKPNTLVYTTTYGCQDQPRVFKAEVAEKHYSIMKGEYYYIEGKYFEYDGKQFGYGGICEEIADFRGARKITSLSCYPFKYHKQESQLRQKLISRGKKFVTLSGVHYKSHHGMAYFKKKKAVVKVNINGRVMVDPSIHRRINPNYLISHVRPKDHDILSEDEDSGGEGGCCGADSSDNGGGCDSDGEGEGGCGKGVKFVTKVIKDRKGRVQMISMPKFDSDNEKGEKLDEVPAKDEKTEKDEAGSSRKAADKAKAEEGDDAKKPVPEFTDEEYLIASPVVLGFAFAEKLWLEFTVSGINEIQWNEHAYESLVLESKTKDIVKALVESHKYHAAESIDDVIQGKGKGLVAVLHGPPGTGKTLTAEGISELLKCPLYMVSAGELGTDSRYLETELQKILDICHAWGAILLLDEADVFLEKRNMHDIHRNALVSIFLRQLEYFQGILFLTTNRVETFDDAFQSRIHIALRYDSLDQRAKKAIFKIFIERVRVLEKVALMPFTEGDYDALARHDLNGRQIKNTVRTAQALAVNKGEPLSMTHIRQVLEVQMSFDRDLKGGPGFSDAMRSYF